MNIFKVEKVKKGIIIRAALLFCSLSVDLLRSFLFFKGPLDILLTLLKLVCPAEEFYEGITIIF